jgi:putative ABC transport system permease protein
MKLGDLFRLAISRLGTGKLRTALTMLGVIIGVASVVALVSVGQGATSGINSRLEGLGTNLLSVTPGSTTTGATRGAFGSATTLTIEDATAMSTLPDVAGVAPELASSRLVVAGSLNETTNVIGTTPAYPLVFAYSMWQGSFLTQASVDHSLRVAVLGNTTATTLGLGPSAIGSTVYISGLPFEVVGIMQPKGGVGFQNPDDEVLIPVTTARDLFVGTDSVRTIGVSVASARQMDTATAELTTLLDQRHGIGAGGTPDFTITSQTQLLSTVGSISTLLTVLLAGIASISLIVGGIGIMNIMLVSVRERTREIGIRKAIGARGRDVLLQFLFEALMLSVAGGLIGIVIGVAASAVIAVLAGWAFTFNPITVLVSVVFSLIVGVIFGVWPASQAARLDPVVALRYE